MWRFTRRAMVLAALCAGALAALLSYALVQRQQAWAAQQTRPVSVVVAAREIPARTVIEPGMVYETIRPVATLPPNCASSAREAVGGVTTVAIAADEPIQRTAISRQSASLGLAHAVPEGMRAVTVALDSIIGVAGFLKAGDHVDVVATFDTDRFDRQAVTRTVLQDVELLAIGPDVAQQDAKRTTLVSSKTSRPKEEPNATLAVTPQDAEKLILAESTGRLRLTLRRAGEDLSLPLAGARSDVLVGSRPASPAPRRVVARPAPAPQPQRPLAVAKAVPVADKVETIRGTSRSTVEVRDN
jgi:pilus assembly protein CpaB